ncbi:putative cytochrome P450 [Nemania abortiva]|nr:putative cytochrome P450 [Nemania abortiva]
MPPAMEMTYISTTLAGASLLLLCAKFVELLLKPSQTRFPLVGKEDGKFFSIAQLRWFKHGGKIIHEAYERFHDIIYQLPSNDRTSIVLPIRYLDEISTLPSDIASNSEATSDFFVGTWTTLDYDIFGHATFDAIQTQYISKISQQVGPAANEAGYAFNKHLSAYADWTPIAIQPKILQIVAQMVARTVAGPDVCRNPQWTEAVIGYARDVAMSAIKLKLVPKVLRPIMALFTPSLYSIRKHRRTILQLISPTINQRLEWRREQPEYWAARLKTEVVQTVDWLVEVSKPHEATVGMIAHRLTGVSFGATHTTSNHITNSILELAANFDRWAPPLREEIESTLALNPGTITNADLSKMWKLDSFMKEAQRFHPPSKLSVNRKILKSFHLSTGESIGKDSHICFSGVPISMDDRYFTDAKSFDGFRFERLRKDADTRHSGLQFTSSYAGSLHFGHGRHICPGRFMGSLISKLLIIEILLRYDLKLKDGETRPENLNPMDMDMPDPTYEILIRNRQCDGDAEGVVTHILHNEK